MEAQPWSRPTRPSTSGASDARSSNRTSRSPRGLRETWSTSTLTAMTTWRLPTMHKVFTTFFFLTCPTGTNIVLSRLTEISGVALIEFLHAFFLDYFLRKYHPYNRKTRLYHCSGSTVLAYTTVQGNCLFKVMGQETCQ